MGQGGSKNAKRAGGVLAALLVALIVIVGVTVGFGGPSLPDDAKAFVEEVEGGEVTPEQWDAAMAQSAARQGIREVPQPGTPQFDIVNEAAMADLLLARWVNGEAEELGIEVTDTAVQTELDNIIEQQFGGQEQFDRFLEQNAFSAEDALDRVRLQLLSERIQAQIVPEDLEVSDDEVQDYYDQNIEQFQTPETRDVRTLLNPDEAEAQEAFDALSADDSPRSWEQVTQRLSTDEATSSSGGLRQGVVQGQNEPALDEAIFSAPEGELVGPIETDSGFYVIQVEKIDAATTQPLDEQTTEQIRQTLLTQKQQELAQTYQTDFLAKWQARTVCAEDVLIDRCGNAPPPADECAGDDEDDDVQPDPATGEAPELACPAPVPSTRPVPPSSAGDPNATGLPQGPVTGAPAPNPLEGALPLGTPGAPTAPGAPAPTPAPAPGG